MTREIEDMLAAVDQVKAAFGAPGDFGYETREGKALFALYRAAVPLRQPPKTTAQS
jgi:hypothetical protein